MTIESEIFLGIQCSFDRLQASGFKEKAAVYQINLPLKSPGFAAEIQVDRAGQVSGKVYDTESGEEYLFLRVNRDAGGFSSQIREEYRELLEKIAMACFKMAQADRIKEQIKVRFADELDFPFKKYPAYAVFRNPHNRKWYGLMMSVTKDKIGITSEPESRESITLLNVKVEPAILPDLLKQDGIYPPYHMNKKNWLSLALDDRLTDEQILDLLAQSRKFTEVKKKKG